MACCRRRCNGRNPFNQGFVRGCQESAFAALELAEARGNGLFSERGFRDLDEFGEFNDFDNGFYRSNRSNRCCGNDWF